VNVVEETPGRLSWTWTLWACYTRITMETVSTPGRSPRPARDAYGSCASPERIIFQSWPGPPGPESRRACLDIAEDLAARGAQAVILGCTELPLLLKGWPAPVPWLDTLEIHARAAMELAVKSA
jgi:hypothetical protein